MIANLNAELISDFIVLSIVVGIPVLGAARSVRVYDSFIEGAKEGFQVAVNIAPYLVGMLVAIGMLRASGAITSLARIFHPVLSALGLPDDVLPLIFLRPLSGSASNAVLVDIISHNGGDAWVSHLAATMMGSTETTFYVIAVYFGVVGIKETRYAITAGLLADLSSIFASLLVCKWLLT